MQIYVYKNQETRFKSQESRYKSQDQILSHLNLDDDIKNPLIKKAKNQNILSLDSWLLILGSQLLTLYDN